MPMILLLAISSYLESQIKNNNHTILLLTAPQGKYSNLCPVSRYMQRVSTHNVFQRSLYACLIAAFLLVVVYQLIKGYDLQQLIAEFQILEMERKNVFLLSAIALLGLNWSLEAYKWKLALNEYVALSFTTSLQGVLAGVTLGLMTPAKLGEYAGRMIKVPADDRATSGVATLLNSIAQTFVTVIFGIIALLGFSYNLEVFSLDLPELYFGSFLFILLSIVVIVKLPFLLRMLSKIKLLAPYLTKLNDITIDPSLLLKLVLLSAFRYGTYALQYVLVFYFLGQEYCVVELLGFVSIVFLIQTLLPLPPIASFIGRGGVAILIFSQIGINEIVIICATLLIWVINLLIPALVGLGVILLHDKKSVQ